jgi:hypothetical protein
LKNILIICDKTSSYEKFDAGLEGAIKPDFLIQSAQAGLARAGCSAW